MKLLADMGISWRVIEWLRAHNHDVIHLREQNLHALSDKEIFEKAFRENRIILTFDLDFGEIVALAKVGPSVSFFFALAIPLPLLF